MPLLFLWSLVLRYQLSIACTIHGRKLRCSSRTVSNKISNSRQPRLIYCTDNNIVLVQQVLVCAVSVHSYLPTSRTILSDPSIPKECYFPYQLYQRCIFSHNLIEHIFLEVINGASFQHIAADLHQSVTWIFQGYIKVWEDLIFYQIRYLLFLRGTRSNQRFWIVYASKRFLFLEYGDQYHQYQ